MKSSYEKIHHLFEHFSYSQHCQQVSDLLVGSPWLERVEVLAALSDFDVEIRSPILESVVSCINHEHGLVFLGAARLLVETGNWHSHLEGSLPEDRLQAVRRMRETRHDT